MGNQEKVIEILEALRADVAATAKQSASQMKKIDEALLRLRQSGELGPLRVPDSGKGTGPGPYIRARVADAAEYVVRKKNLDFTVKDLVQHDDLLFGFANAALRRRNLQNIWDHNLSALVKSPKRDLALEIAENSSATGMALTTLQVTQDDAGSGASVVSVHVVRNNVTGKTMIVGGKTTSKLKEAFAKASIIYVDRTAPCAEAEAADGLKKVIAEQADPYIMDRLRDAFQYRNDLEATPGMAAATVAQAMVSPVMEPFYAKYVVKMT